jgi:inner membrane protein involved in colicin E2 resistance
MNRMLAQKALTIAALACMILIALYMVSGVIDDREKYRNEAVHSIEASYAGPQMLIGPVLVRPYTQTVTTTEIGCEEDDCTQAGIDGHDFSAGVGCTRRHYSERAPARLIQSTSL